MARSGAGPSPASAPSIGCGAERLDARGDEAEPLDAEAGLDRLDLRAQIRRGDAAPSRVARARLTTTCWASLSTRSHRRRRRRTPRPASASSGMSRRTASPPASAIASAVAIGSRKRSRIAGGASGTIGSNGSARAAQRLIEPGQQSAAEAALERRARHGDQRADPLDAQPVGGGRARPSSSRRAASGMAAIASASPPGGQRMSGRARPKRASA